MVIKAAAAHFRLFNQSSQHVPPDPDSEPWPLAQNSSLICFSTFSLCHTSESILILPAAPQPWRNGGSAADDIGPTGGSRLHHIKWEALLFSKKRLGLNSESLGELTPPFLFVYHHQVRKCGQMQETNKSRLFARLSLYWYIFAVIRANELSHGIQSWILDEPTSWKPSCFCAAQRTSNVQSEYELYISSSDEHPSRRKFNSYALFSADNEWASSIES